MVSALSLSGSSFIVNFYGSVIAAELYNIGKGGLRAYFYSHSIVTLFRSLMLHGFEGS